MRDIAFEFVNQTDEELSMYEKKLLEIIETTLDKLKVKEDCELSCIVVDNEEIHRINRDYRQIDRPTDVISFAYEDDECFVLEGAPRELGDIFISIEKAKEQAVSYGHSFEREFCFLFTHGLLHLLGYDHMEESEAKIMFGLQEEILNEKTLPDNVEFDHYKDMFKVALIGIKTAFLEEKNMRFDVLVAFAVLIAAIAFKVSLMEWCILILLISLVFMAEIFNTAIENIVDFICPRFDLRAKKIKDLSCGAVLIICIGSAIVGLMIFLPYL